MRLNIALAFVSIAIPSASALNFNREVSSTGCALPCYEDAFDGFNCGASFDFCICDEHGVLDKFTSCVEKACPPDIATQSVKALEQVCENYTPPAML